MPLNGVIPQKHSFRNVSSNTKNNNNIMLISDKKVHNVYIKYNKNKKVQYIKTIQTNIR